MEQKRMIRGSVVTLCVPRRDLSSISYRQSSSVTDALRTGVVRLYLSWEGCRGNGNIHLQNETTSTEEDSWLMDAFFQPTACLLLSHISEPVLHFPQPDLGR